MTITSRTHDCVVRIEPEDFPTAGTYRGIPEVQQHIRSGRGSWAEGTCDPEDSTPDGCEPRDFGY
jgi:hypothetical protein